MQFPTCYTDYQIKTFFSPYTLSLLVNCTSSHSDFPRCRALIKIINRGNFRIVAAAQIFVDAGVQ